MRRPKLENNPTCTAVSFRDCLAKTRIDNTGTPLRGRSVLEHCQIVGNIAKQLVELLPQNIFNESDKSVIGFLASLHDLGKISPKFQEKLEKAIKQERGDSLDQAIEERYQFHGGATYIALRDLGITDKLAWALGSHHRILIKDNLELFTSNNALLGGSSWAKERENLFKELKNYFQVKEIPAFDSPHVETIAGITQQADWLGSSESFEKPTTQWEALTSTVLKENGFIAPRIKKNLTFEQIFGFSPRDTQQKFIDSVTGPGVYILEAPMGSGKTEAALYAAYKVLSQGQAKGVYFALPTCLTSLKIKERVDEFILKIQSDQSLTSQILVGSRFDSGEFAPAKAWFSQKNRRILDTFGVGTLDQALFASMINKRSFVTLAGLAGKVVILDEVHSYDFFTRVFLETLVKKLYSLGSTVLVLSATLSSNSKRSLLEFFPQSQSIEFDDGYPLITSYSSRGEFNQKHAPISSQQTVNIQTLSDMSAVLDEVVKRAQSGEQILWIENSVADAQKIYREILAKYDVSDIELGLIHSRFLPSHRRLLEDHWVSSFGKKGIAVRKELGRILIGTQVLEQSLDIDADFLVSRLAPIDLLLQRIGRLWRHPFIERPQSAQRQAWIIVPQQDTEESLSEDFCATYKVYYPYILRRTKEVLSKYHEFCLPNDIRTLIEKVYSDRQETDPYFSVPLHTMLHGDGNRLGIRQLQNLAHQAEVRENCQETRLSDPMMDVLVVRSIMSDDENQETVIRTFENELIKLPWKCTDYSLRKKLSQTVDRLLMSIRKNYFTPATDVTLLKEKYHLDQYLYLEDSPLWIATVDNEGTLKPLGKDSPSDYSYRFGMSSGNLGLEYLKRNS